MAQRNYDGTVTLKTRGALAYTPSSSGGGVTRPFARPGAPGGLNGAGGATQGGLLVRQKGAGYAGRSAYGA